MYSNLQRLRWNPPMCWWERRSSRTRLSRPNHITTTPSYPQQQSTTNIQSKRNPHIYSCYSSFFPLILCFTASSRSTNPTTSNQHASTTSRNLQQTPSAASNRADTSTETPRGLREAHARGGTPGGRLWATTASGDAPAVSPGATAGRYQLGAASEQSDASAAAAIRRWVRCDGKNELAIKRMDVFR